MFNVEELEISPLQKNRMLTKNKGSRCRGSYGDGGVKTGSLTLKNETGSDSHFAHHHLNFLILSACTTQTQFIQHPSPRSAEQFS
jgi:hypothetical protein